MNKSTAPTAPQFRRAFSYPDPAVLGYRSAVPFPHAVIRDAWSPDALERCRTSIARFSGWEGEKDFFGSKKKRYCGDIEALPASITDIIHEASAPAFLRWLEAMTGEPALMPDPYLEGGGVHQILSGGFLKVHADFNWNEHLQLYRRLNLLLYLNPNWEESWGGALELWSSDVSGCIKKVQPAENTMVIFTTDDASFHGHPHPMTCPPEVQRNSIALYYYSPVKPTMNFKERRTGTDYRPIDGDTFEYYDSSLRSRIRNRLRRLSGR